MALASLSGYISSDISTDSDAPWPDDRDRPLGSGATALYTRAPTPERRLSRGRQPSLAVTDGQAVPQCLVALSGYISSDISDDTAGVCREMPRPAHSPTERRSLGNRPLIELTGPWCG